MSDSLKTLLEEKGLRGLEVDRDAAGHVTRVRAERADGIEIQVLMAAPAADEAWAKAVLARADPQAFMASILAESVDDAHEA